MIDPVEVGISFAAGAAVGALYFAGLWMTVRALPTSPRPVRLLFVSYVLRAATAGAAFVLLVRAGGWPWAASALAGFVLARTVVVRRLVPAVTRPARGAR